MGSTHYIDQLHKPVILHISSNRLALEQSNPVTGQFKEIFKSEERIVFEFFNPKTEKFELIENLKDSFNLDDEVDTRNDTKAGKKTRKHQPIMIEGDLYDCAVVA